MSAKIETGNCRKIEGLAHLFRRPKSRSPSDPDPGPGPERLLELPAATLGTAGNRRAVAEGAVLRTFNRRKKIRIKSQQLTSALLEDWARGLSIRGPGMLPSVPIQDFPDSQRITILHVPARVYPKQS